MHVDVGAEIALEALSEFKGVKRRLEKRGVFGGVTLYDDFAHHPTAIESTLSALRSQNSDKRILAAFEPKSNTMRMGLHGDALGAVFNEAERVFVLSSGGLSWEPASVLAGLKKKLFVSTEVNELLDRLLIEIRSGDQVVLMSNGDFQGLPRLLQQGLESRVAN